MRERERERERESERESEGERGRQITPRDRVPEFATHSSQSTFTVLVHQTQAGHPKHRGPTRRACCSTCCLFMAPHCHFPSPHFPLYGVHVFFSAGKTGENARDCEDEL